MIDVGAEGVDRKAVGAVVTPRRTETWVPVSHLRLLETVEEGLAAVGFKIASEKHVMARAGHRYFGMLQIENGGTHDDYGLLVGLRNSHDKSFVAGLACGSHVFVCSNLAFSGDVVISRKHTVHIERDLPILVSQALGQFAEQRVLQERRIEAYKQTRFKRAKANDILIRSLDAGVIPASKIPKVLRCWRGNAEEGWEREIDEAFEPRTAWRLFNAYTYVLRGTSVFLLARRTQALHGLMDNAVGL